MKADVVRWEVIPTAEALAALTGAQVETEWTAVAVPDLAHPSAVLAAAEKNGRIWGFIDLLRPIGALTLCRSVKAFHDSLRAGGAAEIHGIRAAHVEPRWMAWLGAERTEELVNGEEVWVWRH